MRSCLIILLLAFGALQYKLWLGAASISQLTQLDKKIAMQEAVNQKLAARNAAVEADIVELKSGEQALEEQARYEFGMIREGEQFYQFID